MARNFLTAIAVVTLVVVLGTLFLVSRSSEKPDEDSSLIKMRLGWQVPWATQGQLVQVLKNTTIAKENDLEIEYKGFTFGGPLNEAALAGEVDVVFTADQPAVTLVSKNSDWVIIGRLMYNRVSLYVPPKSEINSIEDLRGKTVAMPFGAAIQRVVLKAQEEAGLDTINDVNNINLGIYEQSDLVRDPNSVRWGEIDALGGFDPTPAIFEDKGLVRNLKIEKVVSVILMSKEYISENINAPEKFLKAFIDTYDYYRNNIEQANQWFIDESKLDITSNALKIASDIEPNVTAAYKDNIYVDFTEDDYRIIQEAADFLFEQKLISKMIDVKDYVNLGYLDNIK